MSACTTVFAIPDLLELILSFCPPMDLYIFLAIDRLWRSTIDRGLFFQRLLFKRPVAGTLLQNSAWLDAWGFSWIYENHIKNEPGSGGMHHSLHPLLAAITDYPVLGRSSPKERLHIGMRSGTGYAPVVLHLMGPMFEDPEALKITQQTDFRPSWSDNLICQPLPKRLVMSLQGQRPHDAPSLKSPQCTSEIFYLATIDHPQGFTLEKISKAVKSYVRKHQKPDLTYITVTLSMQFD